MRTYEQHDDDRRHDDWHDDWHDGDQQHDAAFRALASPARRRVLSLVRETARPVGELADELGVSQPAVSQHLAVLREARLVTVERDGRRRLYRADAARLRELRSFFDTYWSESLDRLADAAERAAAERSAVG